MRARIDEKVVVEQIGDVMLQFVPTINSVYYNYSRLAVSSQDHFRERKEALDKFFAQHYKSNKHNRLPIDSYFIVPIQRITKYPLLIKSILEATEESSDEYQTLNLVRDQGLITGIDGDACCDINSAVQEPHQRI